MQQHTSGVMGNIILILLDIICPLQQWKNFTNPSRIDKVIAMVSGTLFLTHGVVVGRWRHDTQKR